MERIASALGVTLGEFFQSVGAVPDRVTRADARPTLQSGWSRARIEALGAASDGTRLETVLVTLEPGGSSGSKAHASPREEFALIMEGTIELTLADAEQTLVAGDAVTIPTGTMRRWNNTGERQVRLLIVS